MAAATTTTVHRELWMCVLLTIEKRAGTRDERDWNQVKRAPSTTEEILYTPLLLSSVETLTRTDLSEQTLQ